MLYLEMSPYRTPLTLQGASTLYCCDLYDLQRLILSRRKNCSKFQFCKFIFVHKNEGSYSWF